mgnify:CR=1 FL=1
MAWYLVQYNPILGMVGRYIAFTLDGSEENKERINKFYEEINASDYYHETIVFAIQTDSTDNIEEGAINFMKMLYKKLDKEIPKIQEKQKSLSDEISTLNTQKASDEAFISENTKRVTSIKSELDFESADLAKDKLKEYTNLSNDIKNAIEKSKNDFDDIKSLGIHPLLFQIFLLSDDHYASISDERSVVDAYDGISVFITMHMEGEF